MNKFIVLTLTLLITVSSTNSYARVAAKPADPVAKAAVLSKPNVLLEKDPISKPELKVVAPNVGGSTTIPPININDELSKIIEGAKKTVNVSPTSIPPKKDPLLDIQKDITKIRTSLIPTEAKIIKAINAEIGGEVTKIRTLQLTATKPWELPKKLDDLRIQIDASAKKLNDAKLQLQKLNDQLDQDIKDLDKVAADKDARTKILERSSVSDAERDAKSKLKGFNAQLDQDLKDFDTVVALGKPPLLGSPSPTTDPINSAIISELTKVGVNLTNFTDYSIANINMGLTQQIFTDYPSLATYPIPASAYKQVIDDNNRGIDMGTGLTNGNEQLPSSTLQLAYNNALSVTPGTPPTNQAVLRQMWADFAQGDYNLSNTGYTPAPLN